MSCSNLIIPPPQIAPCVTSLFGIPFSTSGRNVGGVFYPISAIILHCEPMTVAGLCNEVKCRTKSSVISGESHNSYHYMIGASASSGPILQSVNDSDISWTWNTYKNNTYPSTPAPATAYSWPTLQAQFGINTTPDVWSIDIGLAIGARVDANGCYTCPSASGLEPASHQKLIQLLAYLAQEYDIPIDSEHINFHDNLSCGEQQECACTNIEELLSEVANFCPPCESEAMPAPIAEADDEIQYIYGVTEPCCPSSPGCLNLIPWNACFVGDLAVDGTLDNYILGLAQNQEGQWCLTRGCLAVLNPLAGCGTVDDPLVVNISAEPNNQVELRPDGLFVDFTCIDFVDAYPEDDITVFIGQNAAGDCVHQDAVDVVSNVICDFTENMAADPTWLLGKTDAECPVFVTPASIIEAGLIVDDTTTVDLTLTGNVLTADAIISPNADNILVDDSGLYVPDITTSDGFCIHMNYNPATRNINSELIVAALPDNILTCIPGAPGTTGAYVPDLTVVDTDCIDITYVGRQLTVGVIVDPAIDNVLECRANGLYSPLGGGITATDTDCLNLTLVGGILSGVITLAPTQGLVPNIAQCIAGQGFYVPQGAGLNVTDTNCIDLTISNGNLTATLVVNPSGDNQASCGPGGLFVPTAAGLIATDTDCVNHSLVAGVLSTTLNFAPAQGGVPNILSCITGQGLYVPESHLNVIDTTCINLTYAGGILSADIILDPTGDNQVQCLPAGLYVPPAAGLNAIDTDCITLNLAGDTLTSTPILAPTQGGVPNALVCLGSGLYVPEGANLGVLDTSCINLTFADGVISAEPIISPDDCNGVECRGNGLYVNNDVQAVVGVGNPELLDSNPQQIILGYTIVAAFPAWEDIGDDVSVTLTNPSSCNSMKVDFATTGVGFTIVNQTPTLPPNPVPVVNGGFQLYINGAPQPIASSQTALVTAPFGTVVSLPGQAVVNNTFDLAPGATITFRVQPVIQNFSGNFTGDITVSSFSVNIGGINYIG